VAPRPRGATQRYARGERRDDQERGRHLGLEAEPDRDPGQHQPPGAPVLERAGDAPEGRDRAEHEQRIRVVVARDRDGDRRERQDQAGREGRHAAEAPADEVIDERHGGEAHQGLRHEDAQRVEAEDPDRERLDP
jgi:hypothetical protein